MIFAVLPPPSLIFKIIKFLANGVQRIEAHERVKFRQNRSSGCEDIKIFRFFKVAAVHHLGFVWDIFGPPAVSTFGSLSFCKIWLWSLQ